MQKSKCCKAEVYVESDGNDSAFASNWYVCKKCEKPTDVIGMLSSIN